MSDNNSDAVAERGLTTKESVVMFIDELNTILNNIESDYHLDIDHENTERLQAKKGYQREASSIRGSLMENYSDNGKIAHDMYFGFHYCTMYLLDRLIGTKHYYEVIQDLELKRYYNKILFQKYNFESNKKYLEVENSLMHKRLTSYKELADMNVDYHERLNHMEHVRSKAMLKSISKLDTRRAHNRENRRSNLSNLSSSSIQELTNNNIDSWTMKHDIIRNNRYLQKKALKMLQ